MTDIGTSEATAPPVTGTQNTVRADFVDVGKRETLAGGILVGITMVAALFFRWHPSPIFLDRWGFSLVHPAIHNSWWIHVTYLRATPVLVGGSILAAVIVAGRDRWRALACLVAPTVAVMLTELVLKPEIARRYAHVLTFPSGTTTIVSAVVMAFVIAVPTRIRWVAIVIGAFVVALECMAVVALQWHFPTDAVGGAIFGVGMVLLIDGILHVEVGIHRRRAEAQASDTVPVA